MVAATSDPSDVACSEEGEVEEGKEDEDSGPEALSDSAVALALSSSYCLSSFPRVLTAPSQAAQTIKNAAEMNGRAEAMEPVARRAI